MSDPISLYIPTSRFISGDLTVKRTTDADRRPIDEDKQRYEFGLALRKDDKDVTQFWHDLLNGAKACYPTNAQAHAAIDAWVQNGFQGFSMKVSDGDKPNRQGQINENSAGCWVIWFSSNYMVEATDATNAQIDLNAIKRGYFCDALASLAPNNLLGTQMGIYMNPTLLRLQAQGEEIRGGIDVQAALAQMPTPSGALPPGAQPLGTLPTPAPLPGAGPLTAQTPAPGQIPGVAPTAPPTAPAGPAGPAPTQPPAPPSPTASMPTSPGQAPQHPNILTPPIPGVPQG